MKVLERKGGSSIGLDLGSGAVRAVEMSRTRRGLVLHRFAQVGLPHGAIVDGEIIDPVPVSAALRRLWSEGGFTSRDVIVALSGQRVIVRQAEVMAMSGNEFRSALTFQAMDLIPIPVDDAQLDFVIIPRADTDSARSDHMQIVLAASHRRVVQGHLAVLREASLRAVAIDPAPMAAARAAVQLGTDSHTTVAVVDIGADLTVVTIVEEGHVRFSRILNGGGADLTSRIAERRSIGRPEAEAVKRDPGRAAAGTLLTTDLDPLVADVEGSIAFFATQLTGSPIGQVLLTGGASRDPDLVGELARRMPAPLRVFDPLHRLDCEELDLGVDDRLAASASSLVAVGAAEWAWETPPRRLSLLPGEVAAVAQMRRRIALAAVGVAVVAAGLSVASVSRAHQVHREGVAVDSLLTENRMVQADTASLAPVAATHSAIQQRLTVLRTVGAGNVAWSTLLTEITAAMPPHTTLTSLSFDGPDGTSASIPSTGGASAEGGAGPLGSVTMSVTGLGTEDQVAVWLRAFRTVPGLQAVWIPSATTTDGKVTFTSTGGITERAPLVDRAHAAGSGS